MSVGKGQEAQAFRRDLTSSTFAMDQGELADVENANSSSGRSSMDVTGDSRFMIDYSVDSPIKVPQELERRPDLVWEIG